MKLTGDDFKLKQYIDGDELKAKMHELIKNIVFYGSPQVVITFSDWKKSPNAEEVPEELRKIGRVLLSMRDDIGLSNAGLDEASIVRPYFSARKIDDGGVKS